MPAYVYSDEPSFQFQNVFLPFSFVRKSPSKGPVTPVEGTGAE